MAATVLSTPSNSNVKMRWKEPYVSEGLNKKLNGIIAPGILRGGRLETTGAGHGVRILADPETGDSVYSYVNANGHQLTFRQAGNITLDLSGIAGLPTDVYIALYLTYSISAATVAEWRSYSIADLTTAPVAEASEVIVVGRVTVPAVGPIPASNITPELRKAAWEAESQGLSKWIQIVENGSWDAATVATISGSSDIRNVVGWSEALASANYTWRIVETAPRTGAHELEILGDGASTETRSFLGDKVVGVRPGRGVRVRYYIRGNAWGGIGASGSQGVFVTFRDKNKLAISSEFVEDVTLSGTFGYTLIDKIVEAPALAAYVEYGIRIDTDGLTPSGSVFFDDVRVWVERGQSLEEDGSERVDGDTRAAMSAHVTPRTGAYATITEMIENTLRIDNESIGAGAGVILARMMGAAAKGFDVDAVSMGVQIQRAIKDLGGSLLSNSTDPLIARIEANYAPNATARYTLMWESGISSGTSESIRIYASEQAYLTNAGITITVNARWDGSLWYRDAADDSMRIDLRADRFLLVGRNAADADGWTDTGGSWTETLSSTLVTAFGGGQSIETDGRFRYSGSSSNQFNAPQSSKTIAGALSFDTCTNGVIYRPSVAKCWGTVQTGGGGAANFALKDGFNIDTISISGGNLIVGFSSDMSNADFSVMVTSRAGFTAQGVSLNEATTGFDIAMYTISAGAAVDLSTTALEFSFVVFGRD